MSDVTINSAASEGVVSTPAQHTPGPWRVDIGELSGCVEVGVNDAQGNFICTMHGIPPTANQANARLIAAAPDMLAALYEAESAIASHNLSRKHEGSECPWDFGEGFGGCLDKIRAAILKATGAAQ